MRIGIDIDDTVAQTYEKVSSKLKKVGYDITNHQGSVYFHDKFIDKFLNKIGDEVFPDIDVKEDAVRVINNLKKQGYQIYFITARSNNNFKDPYQLSYNWLTNKGFKFDKLIVNAKNKADDCTQNNIDYFIDDSVKHCQNVSNLGVNTYLFSAFDNRKNQNLNRVSNWKEIEQIFNDLK